MSTETTRWIFAPHPRPCGCCLCTLTPSQAAACYCTKDGHVCIPCEDRTSDVPAPAPETDPVSPAAVKAMLERSKKSVREARELGRQMTAVRDDGRLIGGSAPAPETEKKCACPRFSARADDSNTCVCGHESDEHSLLRSVCCATRVVPPVPDPAPKGCCTACSLSMVPGETNCRVGLKCACHGADPAPKGERECVYCGRFNCEHILRATVASLTADLAAAKKENEALVAAIGFMPLSLRKAVSERDVAACAAWAKKSDEFQRWLQEERDRERERASAAEAALAKVEQERDDLREDVAELTAAIEEHGPRLAKVESFVRDVLRPWFHANPKALDLIDATLSPSTTRPKFWCHYEHCQQTATHAPKGSECPVVCWSHAGDFPEWAAPSVAGDGEKTA